MAFTITIGNGGRTATVIGTNSSDAIAAAALANIDYLTLSSFDSDDVVQTGTTSLSGGSSLSPSLISVGAGDDQVTLNAPISAVGSIIVLGEGYDTLGIGNNALTGVSIKGLGGVDEIGFGNATYTSLFVNGNEAGDRINVGIQGQVPINAVFSECRIVGGSDDDRFNFNTSGAITGGRINGQDGNDWILVQRLGPATTTTMYGGQGNDNLSASGWRSQAAPNYGFVLFSGDLGDDRLNGAEQGAVQLAVTNGDRLFGGDGDDFIQGRGGTDTMTGGSGVDTFAFSDPTSYPLIPVRFNDNDQSGAFTAGDTINLNTTQGIGTFNNWVTNITDFSSEDFIGYPLGLSPVSAIGQPVPVPSPPPAAQVFGSAALSYKFAGVYNAADSTFVLTADNLGTDTLLVLQGQSPNAFLLLKGTSASSLTKDNFFAQ